MNETYLKKALEKEPNRMHLINLAARRCRELARGGNPMIVVNPNETPTHLDIALREIAEGKILYESLKKTS